MTPNNVSLARMAHILGVTEQEVIRLTREGVLKRETEKRRGHLRVVYPWEVCVRAYIAHQTRRSTQAKEDYQIEKSETQRLVREQRELDLAVARGDLVSRRAISNVMIGLFTTTRNHILAIPSKISHALIGLTDRRAAHRVLHDALELALREQNEFDPESLFKRQNEKNGERRSRRRTKAQR